MDKASTQTTSVVTALEIMHSVQPWPGASPENVAAVILFKRGIRFRASVAPTLEDILPPCRVSRCFETGDITVWQGPQAINWTVREPKPMTTDSASEREDLLRAIDRATSGSFPNDYSEINDLVRLLDSAGDFIRRAQAELDRHYTEEQMLARVAAERERCAALVDPENWEHLYPSDDAYGVLEQAARKIRGD